VRCFQAIPRTLNKWFNNDYDPSNLMEILRDAWWMRDFFQATLLGDGAGSVGRR